MTLRKILKAIGKDLSHVGEWIEDGLKVAGEAAAIVDPPLGTILNEAEAVLSHLLGLTTAPEGTTHPALTPTTVQQVVTAVAAIKASGGTVTVGTKATA